MLKIAKDLSLPVEAVTSTFAILAVRGSGKSHTASVMAEEMLKAGQPVVVYDPTGAWWGLKSSADGKKAGFPVVIFGGEHADVPLEETAGEMVANTVVENRLPAILDCSLMRKAARVRFMTDFSETLYHRNREPLHVFLDEAQTVAPQNIRAMPEASRCLGAIEDIILQGRRRGLGLTAIGPRPALINANVRSACKTLIAMRLSGTHDRKAIDEWIEAHGDPGVAREMLASLAALPVGDGWVWDPPSGLFRRVHFRDRETFDSSATPKVGGRVIEPQKMAQIDLDALGVQIKATVEKAKANDPKALQKRIRELELAAKSQQPLPADSGTIERAVTKAIKERDKHWQGEIAKLTRDLQSRNKTLQQVEKAALDIAQRAHLNGEATIIIAGPPAISVTQKIERPAVQRPSPRPKAAAQPVEGISRKQQQILDAIYWWESLGELEPRNEQVGAIALIDTSGGYFSNCIGPLVTSGLVDRGNGCVKLTDAGRAAARPLETVASLDDYHNMLRERVRKSRNANGKTLAILDALIEAGGDELSNEQIGESVEIDTSGGYFSNSIGPLSTIGLIERRAGRVRPTELLFPPGIQ